MTTIETPTETETKREDQPIVSLRDVEKDRERVEEEKSGVPVGRVEMEGLTGVTSGSRVDGLLVTGGTSTDESAPEKEKEETWVSVRLSPVPDPSPEGWTVTGSETTNEVQRL